MEHGITTRRSPGHDIPSIELHRAVRAALVAKGQSLSEWCRDNGVQRQNAAAALTGRWTGPTAKALVERLAAVARD
jgi:lambda repressor-like predicted transcriptional regulator